jgi:phosphopantothenoylcysteine decarboxylase/phosphopantothenate--cysteine ligase
VKNPDLLAEIGAKRNGQRTPVLVGFALETGAGLVAYARGKLASKKCDFVVANEAADSLGKDENRATLVDANAVDALAPMTKKALADAILDRVARSLSAKP